MQYDILQQRTNCHFLEYSILIRKYLLKGERVKKKAFSDERNENGNDK